MQPLHKKRIDYIAIAHKRANKLESKINKTHILWILKRFIYYTAKLICHGRTVTIPKRMNFTGFYVNSSNFEKIKKASMYAYSGAIHGVFFSMSSKGKFTDEFEATFKPSLGFRKQMEYWLDNPDLTYKLIS